MAPTLSFGFVVFDNLTQLDLAGPFEVFGRVPGARVELVGESRAPVRSDVGLNLYPDRSIEDGGGFDVLCVPGGPGVTEAIRSERLIRFLATEGQKVKYLTSVCTGALLLGAAGLLQGKRATTHWLSLELLPLVGATPVRERVVRDGNLFTGGGVTAGIDLGLTVAAELAGADEAKAIALILEYNPASPFPESGSPVTAPAAITRRLQSERVLAQEKRASALKEIFPLWAKR